MINLSLQPQSGAVAGWKLELTPVTPPVRPGEPPTRGKTRTYSSDDFRGSIDATLLSGLAGGSFTVVVEDVSENDFRELAEVARGKAPLEARLYLFWVDAPRPAKGADGLVAVLRVTVLRRRPGRWRYEMVVVGREWVHDRMTLPCPYVTGDGPLGTAVAIARKLFIELDPAPVPPPTTEKRSSDPTLRTIEQMIQLETAMVAEAAKTATPRAGLGMYLIRDGKLRLGPDRLTVPLKPPRLDADSGLLAIERNGAVREDETPVGIDDDNPPRRDLFVATLRGRPDLKPGDIVEFKPPEQAAFGEELGFALGPGPQPFTGTHVTAYIQEVNHRLSREQGFLTVVHCVAASSDAAPTAQGVDVDQLWFQGSTVDSAAGGGSSESILSRVFDRVLDRARIDRWPDVAQVRAQNLPTGDPGTPPLTEKLWRGLEEPDGLLYGAARQRFAKVKKELASAPYLTPFAYGPWGLTLPRYPGMRVLVVNRRGDPDDPVEVGALWSRGEGPPAQMGDWWLSLPVDLDGDRPPRASVDDNDAAEPVQSGGATNDLIDAHGNRVIEVGKLTIRIGKNDRSPTGVRPSADDDPVSIEYDGGRARITIAQDGSITIKSAKTLTLKGTEGITLESGADVTIKAGGKVDVKKGT